MAEASGHLRSFMAGTVSIPRWRLYLARYVFLFFAMLAVQTAIHVPLRYALTAVAGSLAVATFWSWFVYRTERTCANDQRLTTND